MTNAPYALAGRAGTRFLLAVSIVAIASCSSSGPDLASGKPTRSKEYFAESEYGVKASPRVSNLRTRLPRGGGRDQVGRPYMVKGKWYHPKEVPGYRNKGMASWYGDAFHGRLTANGEVYDMTHLTAAHPTMPLPSYARVTNTKNGSSVIVRVNDRGPYAHGRIIDLSRRAAELLDYTHSGVANVSVEYLGRAPLHGQDDEFLMASYRPGGQGPSPSDGLPTGVMIAMAGPTPTTASAAVPVFPGQSRPGATISATDPILPDLGPIAPERPGATLAGRTPAALNVLAYADERVKGASLVLDNLAQGGASAMVAERLGQRYAKPVSLESAPYIAVGTYPDEASARSIAKLLDGAGVVKIETDWRAEGFSVSVHPDGRRALDDILQTAWAAGASDAMTIRE